MVLMLVTTVGAVDAAEYRLQVASIDETVFLRYVERQEGLFRAEKHILPRLEEVLNDLKQSQGLLFSDRKVQPLDPERVAQGQVEPVEVHITFPKRGNPWMTATWEGTPGKVAAFRVSGYQVNWQELTDVAVNTDGVLRRLPVQSIPLFGRHKLLAPAAAASYIDHALQRGTFGAWVTQHAVSHGGLSVIVGRNHDATYPDTVYLMVRMPPEPKTYKVVLAWKNREVFEHGDFGDNVGPRDN
jgi:hypothetical protein